MVDTGVDLDQPDLAGQLLPGATFTGCAVLEGLRLVAGISDGIRWAADHAANVWSTIPVGTGSDVCEDGSYDSYAGTSMATPHMAGVVALRFSQGRPTAGVEKASCIPRATRSWASSVLDHALRPRHRRRGSGSRLLTSLPR